MREPPLGVMPEWLWNEKHHSPTISDRRARLKAVGAAIERARAAGREPLARWIEEYSSRLAWWRFEIAAYVGLLLMLLAWGAFLYWIGVR